jgi:hypothetical protein
MNRFTVFSGYRQFYVADAELEPSAPEVWTDEHVEQKYNTNQYITALCPDGDISARIIVCGPNEVIPEFSETPDFEAQTAIEILSGKIGVFEWPWELQIQYEVPPGHYAIIFTGFNTEKVDQEEDFYLVHIKKTEQDAAANP